ncbi:MAG: hypothetical protein Q9157_005570 [Trypethelium eluteriae]
MAIISSVPGIEVAVTVDGSDVKEYTDPDLAEEPNVVTKYIEVSSECEFANANDHSPVHEREQVKKLGTIEIIVEHRQQFGLKKPSSFAQQDLGILSEVLSEKSLKGQSLSQSVS